MQLTTQWYSSFSEHTFPTLFIRLTDEEQAFLIGDSADQKVVSHLEERLQQAMNSLPGKSFVALDNCAPTDVENFIKLKAQSSASSAIKLLQSSEKVKTSLKEKKAVHLYVRPYRRMDKTREFRLFIHNRQLVGMSQYCLERHFRRLEGRKDEFWNKALAFAAEVTPFLQDENQIIDIYFTSNGTVLINDFNDWGEATPLLLRSWDRDWSEVAGIKLMKPPRQMKGNVEVTF